MNFSSKFIRENARMLSNGITTIFKVCVLALYSTSTAANLYNDFRFISYQDLQSSTTGFQSEGNTSFSQMLFDVSRNQIIAGARDGLYRLSLSKLKLLEYASWASPDTKRMSCIYKGQSEENCHNYIKVLLSNGRQILACGTNSFSPQCSWREIDNITNIRDMIEGVAKCPYNPSSNVTAFLSEDGEYYFGGPTDFSGSDSLISKSVGATILRTKQYNPYWLNEPQFVGSFESDRFVYFLFREAAVEFINCGKSVYSRIARVCKNDRGGEHAMLRDNWTTFLKARLNCSISSDYPFYFDEIQSMSYVANENIVYATFSTAPNSIAGSAICAFNLTAINYAFDGSFKHQQDMDSAWSSQTNNYVDHFSCEPSKRETNLPETSKYQLMDLAVQPTTLNPLHVTILERLTHLTVDIVETKLTNVHVIYVATSEGKIKKLSLLPPYRETCIVEIWQAVPDVAISIKNIQFLKETNSVYITTSEGLAQISTDHCNRHVSYETCKNAMDPYCGWNEREETCSVAPDGNPHSGFWRQPMNSCPVLDTPVDGGWSTWTDWSLCSHRVSSGSEQSDYCYCQTRSCNNPTPANNGKVCTGSPVQVANCTVHGGWSDWSAWSSCSATCGTAVKTRSRTCTNPAPAFGGRVCVGQDRSEAFCAESPPCPSQQIDGGWGPWSPWSACTVDCGGGYRLRQRKCDNPTPHNGGQHCRGNDIEYARCREEPCNEHKKTLTTDWYDVSTLQKRFKITCKAPVKHQNQIKIQIRDEEKHCSSANCNYEENEYAGWTPWNNWNDCSVTCGGGVQRRTRYCKRGRNCIGESTQTRECNTHNCEDTWGCWSEWSPCNVSCGWGVKTRSRICLGQKCNGPPIEQQPCEDQPCEGILGWGNWTEWSLCDDNSEQHRKRRCFHENPGPYMCQGKAVELRMCLGEISNEIFALGNQMEQSSCVSIGLSFFFIGAIVGILPGLIYLIFYILRRKKNTIPSSPHYMTAQQNPYISVPTREKLSKKQNNCSSSCSPNGTTKSIKHYADDFEVPSMTLKRNSHEVRNGHSKLYEGDKFLYD
ncbi:unnamed protein product [Phaedon cochleariae]|uniref:Sema domain-containing protein n=1 Tax=Phaedon cochleariae TaxID=80249 RepID=A0A9P0GS35_PHACE|nr:unnamed protein product [Phaedon cochleariae]